MNINDVYLSVFDSSQFGVYCHRAGHRLFRNGNRFIWLLNFFKYRTSLNSQLWTKINDGTFENSPARLTAMHTFTTQIPSRSCTFILSFFHLLVHNTEFSSTVKQFNERHPLSIINATVAWTFKVIEKWHPILFWFIERPFLFALVGIQNASKKYWRTLYK